MKYLLGLFIALTLAGCEVGCQLRIEQSPEAPVEHVYGVSVAVGSGGSIYRSLVDLGEEVAMGNPNLPSSRILQGDYTFAGNVKILGAFTQGNQNQQSGVNVSGAAGQIGSVTNPFFGDLFVRGTLYQQLGQQWVGPITNPFGATTIEAISYGGGVYVAGGLSGKLSRSTDYGATWSALINAQFGAGEILGIGYGNGIFLAVGDSGGAGIISRSSDLGLTWVSIANPFAGEQVFNVAYGGGVFVAVSTTGKIARSTDLGLTWANIANPFPGTIFRIAFGNGVFVACGAGAFGGPGTIARSSDFGITWGSLIANPLTNSAYTIVFGNGVFVVGSSNSEIVRSVDNGATWGSLIPNPFTQPISEIAYEFGIFQAAGLAAQGARSYDGGLTWGSLITNPFGANAIYGIASSSQNMVAVGQTGSIATAGWNAAANAPAAPLPQAAAGVGQFKALLSAANTALYLTDTGGVGGTSLGGTWQWFGWGVAASFAMADLASIAAAPTGISAGGTQIMPAWGIGVYTRAIIWRIA